jgi:hypothetical protein
MRWPHASAAEKNQPARAGMTSDERMAFFNRRLEKHPTESSPKPVRELAHR